MAKRLDPKVAEKVALKAGFKPLEPYVGSGKPWKCKCLKCGKCPSPTLDTMRQGYKCAYCAKRKIDPKDAEAVMLKAGLKPLEPFKTGLTKWKCIHIECGEIVYPPYKEIKAGRYGCATCGMKSAGLIRRIPEKKAISVMLKAKLKPLEPYKGADKKWKCKCLGCGDIVYPKYNSVLQRGGACTTCGTIRRGIKRRTPEDKAIETMLKAKLKPLEPYTNTKTRWKCKCLKCGTVVHPTLGDIVAGDGGCSICAPFGINMLNPSYLYLITHANLNAHKVGIGNHKKKKDRLDRFIKEGWKAHKVWEMKTGTEALEIEKAVFKILRKDMKLPIYLSKEDMPKTEGHSETVDADSITLLQLEKIIKKVIRGMKNG